MAIFNVLGDLTPTYFGSDNVPYEMGMIFYVTKPAKLLGFRNYINQMEPRDNQKIGKLWDNSTGNIITTSEFIDKLSYGSQGWIETRLSTFYQLEANKYYTASLNIGNNGVPGHYATYIDYFVNDVIVGDAGVGQIIAPSPTNNVFADIGVFPTGSYRSSCYFADVIIEFAEQSDVVLELFANLNFDNYINIVCDNSLVLDSNLNYLNLLYVTLLGQLLLINKTVFTNNINVEIIRNIQIIDNLNFYFNLILNIGLSLNSNLYFNNQLNLISATPQFLTVYANMPMKAGVELTSYTDINTGKINCDIFTESKIVLKIEGN